MRLPRLLRTANFRLTLFYAGMFSLSVLALFAIIAWSTTQSMQRQIDDTVRNDLTEVLAMNAGSGLPGLVSTVRQMSETGPGVWYLLEDRNGAVLAGNLPQMPAREGLVLLAKPPRLIKGPNPGQFRRRHHRKAGLRGRGVRLAETPWQGAWLLVTVSDGQLSDMRDGIAHGFLAGLAGTILFAVLNGLAASFAILRRIEAFSRSSRDIMAGDLGRRIGLRGTDDEFDHLASSLNAMFDRIQTLMSGMQQITSDIAHDLRTPLSRLRQRLELALRREDTKTGLQGAIEASIEDTDAILRTFAALLRLAQIEGGSRRAGFSTTALGPILEELADIYGPVAEERRQVLTCRFDAELSIRGDRELLTQAIANLIENAINHAGSGAHVDLYGEHSADTVRVIVTDDGPGIPAADRARVLNRFYRLESSRTTPGQGLGLSLVRAIADLHDASLHLDDNSPGLRCVLQFQRAPAAGTGDPLQARTVASMARP